MAVVRKNFTGTLSAAPSTLVKTHTITGLTSETSTTNVSNIVPELSMHLLNALYETLIEAGYSDTVKNEDEYSITVLGFKFFVFSSLYGGYCFGFINTYGCNNANFYINNNGNYANYALTLNLDINYKILVRGDENHISIYASTYDNPNTDYAWFTIAKGKNLITSSDIYMFGFNINGYQYIREKDNLYSPIVSNAGVYTNIPNAKGTNTNSKFACVPQLVHYNTILIPSMIQGNTAIFANNKYYKIGSEIYYNENNYLFKVG